MPLITATSALALAVYLASAIGSAASAQDAPSATEVITSPALQSANPAPQSPKKISASDVRGVIEVIESPSAKTRNAPSPDQTPPAAQTVTSTPLSLTPAAPAPTPDQGPTPLVNQQSSTAPSDATLANTPSAQLAAPQADAQPADSASDKAAQESAPPQRQRSLIRDPLTARNKPNATFSAGADSQSAMPLPTLSQIEGPGAAHTKETKPPAKTASVKSKPSPAAIAATAATPPSTGNLHAAPSAIASAPIAAPAPIVAPPSPPPATVQSETPGPAPTTSNAPPTASARIDPTMDPHVTPPVAKQPEAQPQIQAAVPPPTPMTQPDATIAAPAPSTTQSTALTPPPDTSAAPVTHHEDRDMVDDVASYLATTVGHLPGDLALVAVFALCIVFGLIGAGIRRSRETYD